MRAISNDVEYTHSNKLVHQGTFLYSIALQYLLKNPRDPQRAQNAFDYALDLSKDMKYEDEITGESCQKWLLLAQKMTNDLDCTQNRNEYLNALQSHINCTKQEGWIKKAFVLSFYHLLQA